MKHIRYHLPVFHLVLGLLLGLLCLFSGSRVHAQAPWSYVAPMPTARYAPGATVGPDRLIYVTGGYDGNILSTVEAYDTTTNTWTSIAPMTTPRFAHGCATGLNRLIYVIGGSFRNGSSFPAMSSVEAYNVKTHTWTAVAPMNSVRRDVAAVTGPDGRIYAIGGEDAYPGNVTASVEVYDPYTNTWTYVAPMNTARCSHGAALGPDGQIYVIGGYGDSNYNPLTSVEAYDPSTNTWTNVAPLNTAQANVGATTGPDGRIYAIGSWIQGASGDIALDTVEGYTVATNSWAPAPSLNAARGILAAATGTDGRLYAFGGWNSSAVFLNTAEACTVISVKSLKLSPNPVVGSTNAKGTVTLSHPAPSDGITVSLASANSDVANPTVASITIPAGSQTGTFLISTTAVSKSTPVIISAGGKRAVLTVQPIGVKSVTLLPSTVIGMNFVIGVVTLEAASAPGNISVTLSSSDPTVAILPITTLTIDNGYTEVAFSIYTGLVTSTTQVSISATANGITASRTLTIKP